MTQEAPALLAVGGVATERGDNRVQQQSTVRIDKAWLKALTLSTYRLGLEIYEDSNTCIHSSLALVDVLNALNIAARPLRVEAKVFNFSLPRDQGRGCVLGGDGNGTFRPKSTGWRGHLTALADERYLLDPTLPQAGYGAVPMVIDVDIDFLTGKRRVIVPTGSEGAEAHFYVYPRQIGWKSVPAARPSQRWELVERLLDQQTRFGPNGNVNAFHCPECRQRYEQLERCPTENEL